MYKGGKRLSHGYILVLAKNHPFADNMGYVAEHRLIMEKHIGRYLEPSIVVHHKNGNIQDNRIENLGLGRKSRALDKNCNWKGGRRKRNGYISILAPNHPRTDGSGYVREHILIMENYLGRQVTKDEIVHHINGIKNDNRIENLKLFPSRNEHIRYHRLKDIKMGISLFGKVPREGQSHRKAKTRLYDLIKTIGPKLLEKEHEYPNPVYPDYPWYFDLYCELDNGRRIAIEIDGKVGHSSKKAMQKREWKQAWLKTKGIELFAFPTTWVQGRRALPDQLFYDELHLAK